MEKTLVQQNQTGNPTRLRKSYNLFQYIIIRSKERTRYIWEIEQDPSIHKHTSKTIR